MILKQAVDIVFIILTGNGYNLGPAYLFLDNSLCTRAAKTKWSSNCKSSE